MLVTVGPGSAIDQDTGEWYYGHAGEWRKVALPAPQRKPETGERLDGAPKPFATGLCYCCRKHPASVYFSAAIPQCVVCYDRFRRKSG
jgi:hypothetical protein